MGLNRASEVVDLMERSVTVLKGHLRTGIGY